MANESVGIEVLGVESLHQVNSWLTNNSDLFIQYGVNIISAILILFIGNLIVKTIAGSLANVLMKKEIDKAVVDFIQGIVRYTLLLLYWSLH